MEFQSISSQRLDETALPSVRHEQQPDIGLALRKEVLHRRGVINSSTVRAPGIIWPTFLGGRVGLKYDCG